MTEKEYHVGDGWVCHTPDPNAYHDPSSMSLLTAAGRPLTAALPGRYGLRGTVVPRATILGGSRHKGIFKAGKVQIDPGVEGQPPLHIDIAQLNEDQLNDAIAESAEGAEDMRDVAYKTFSKLAGVTYPPSWASNQMTRSALTPVDLPNASNVPRASTGLEVPKPRRASFSKRPESQEESIMPEYDVGMEPVEAVKKSSSSPSSRFVEGEVMPRKAAQVSNSINPAFPPGHRVTFELDGFGTIETSYHEIIQGEDGVSLVLIYDNRFDGGTKYFPPVSDNDLFVDVHEFPYIFKVKSAGLWYKVGDKEHHILLIEKSAAKDEQL